MFDNFNVHNNQQIQQVGNLSVCLMDKTIFIKIQKAFWLTLLCCLVLLL